MILFTMTWQQGWELVGWTMCYFLASGSVVALGGALLRMLCKHAAPQIRYATSLAVFATLAALPIGIAVGLSQSMPIAIVPNPIIIDLANTPISMPALREPIELANITIVDTPTADTRRFADVLAHQNDGAIAFVAQAIENLPWVWIVGTPLTFALLATGLVGSQRLRRQSTPIVDGPIFEACQRLRTSLVVSRRVGVVVCDRIATPLLVGIVRPLILLPPAALTGWSPDELKMVLLHELAHVRRWDNLVNFLQRIVESLLFFHPAVWWVSRWVRRDREECCDAVVVARTAKPQAYAELLVALAAPQSVLSSPLAGLAMAQHPLAGRIRRILKLEDEKMLVSRGTFGWFGLLTAALLVVVVWQPASEIVAEETSKDVVKKEEKTTENTRKPGVMVSLQAIYQVPMPAAFADPRQFEIWQDTQLSVLKSKFIIDQARLALTNEFPDSLPPNVSWFQDNLQANFLGEDLVIELQGNLSEIENHKRLRHYMDAVVNSYIKELKIHNALTASEAILPPFLSLEDQRAADLAYKLLNTELGPLGNVELERVKAKKFSGGLLVTDIKAASTRGDTPNLLRQGDLLVGLHVWPTTSLPDVQKILEREDISELSPLKFYVIRPTKRIVSDPFSTLSN